MKIYTLLLVWTLSLALLSGKTNYDVALIPQELKENAQVVVRHSTYDFTIHSDNRSTLKVHYALTILHEAATEKSDFRVYYNKFNKISNINGTVYDAQGKKVKSLKFYLEDHSAISSTSLYSDSRVKTIQSPYFQVPFTVEYSYDVATNGTLDYPNFYTIDYATSVEKAEHIVRVPKDKSINYYNQNIAISPIISDKKDKVYHWKVENQTALKHEAASLPKGNLRPMVYISPIQFKMDGYEGSNTSWLDFGQWIYNLNQGKSDLSEESKQSIRALTAEAQTKLEKIKILYHYMQNRTRYVNIQIGIGGWQPFAASVVHEQGYGDCKALTNYMQALLEAVDIPSYYALVKAGRSATLVNAQEPGNQFNHAILCVPLARQDTIWLECTSQTHPFGYVSTFWDDRYALIIKSNASKLVRTTCHSQHENVNYNHCDVIFDENLKAYASLNTYQQGMFFDYNQHLLFKDAIDEKRAILNSLKLKDFNLKNHSIHTYLDSLPYIKLNAIIDVNNYCTIMGEKVFFKLNMINQFNDIPGYAFNRKNALFIRRAYSIVDKINYKIPDNYVIKSLPESHHIQSKFGQYQVIVKAKDNMIVFDRSIEIYKGIYPKEDYEAYIEFLEKIAKYDRCSAEINSL